MKSFPYLFVVVGLLTVNCATDDPLSTRDTGTDTRGTHADVGSGEDTSDPAPDAAAAADANLTDSGITVPDASGEADAAPDAAADLGSSDDTGDNEPAGDTCDEAIDATAGGTFVGDTATASGDYDATFAGDNCPSGAASGPDIVYALSPAADTTYDVTVTPDGNFDPFLHAKSDCAIDDCIDGTVLNGPGTKESLELFVPGGSTYFLIVDGELGSSGSYTLEVAVQ